VASHDHDIGRFDEWAATYDRHWMQRWLLEPVQRMVLDVAATHVPKPRAVLDVGCGTGRLLRAARERFPSARLEGVDAAPEMVKQARLAAGEGLPINFQEATAEELPFADATFDVVTSTLTFHHWADQSKGISEIGRVLTPVGVWVLADFIPSGLAALITRGIGAHRMPERGRLDAMLAKSALSVNARRAVWRTMGNVSVLAITRAPEHHLS
jgi:ubiquinone/menaquinone biosynthesis C-methylase UbiE